jgi:hypothetical protein
MQGLQLTIPSLQDHGPVVEAEIHTDEETFLSVKNHNGYKKFSTVKLLIDTGSNISGIDKNIINRLQLNRYKDDAMVDGVIGRDVLKYCSFAYDGWSHTFKLVAVDL